jgi:hypothetical protein
MNVSYFEHCTLYVCGVQGGNEGEVGGICEGGGRERGGD